MREVLVKTLDLAFHLLDKTGMSLLNRHAVIRTLLRRDAALVSIACHAYTPRSQGEKRRV